MDVDGDNELLTQAAAGVTLEKYYISYNFNSGLLLMFDLEACGPTCGQTSSRASTR